MELKGLGTFKAHIRDIAATLRVDGIDCRLSQAQLAAYRLNRGIVAEIKAQTREHGISLPEIFIHINRDGSLALATGSDPITWPEGLIMVRSVEEINITNWQVTGSNVPIPQYQFNLEIKWTDNDGNPRVHTGTYRYPNDIASMPLAVRGKYAEDMVVAAARVALGIDDWGDYS